MLQEIRAISGNSKGALFLFVFRLASGTLKRNVLRILGTPLRLGYTVIVQWLLGIDIPLGTEIGFAPSIYHGMGLVIHRDTLIGDRVRLHHNTTIGVARPGGKAPRIGNDVVIGANSVVIGDIEVGDGAVVAAGSVVIRDVPARTVVAGNPAREVGRK